ncbi:MAG: hypothetical protein SF187_27850 [Deltaproteobacteria bacterium]|nr:hypothetical protein [Deltaproteobacteria bacterium]
MAADRRRVSLELSDLKASRLFEFKMPGVRDAQHQTLVHTTADYTLNKLQP